MSVAFALMPARGVARGTLDFGGTGRAVEELREGQQVVHTYERAGLHAPTFRYRDASGESRRQSGLVVVFDRVWLEPVVRARGEAFLDAVRADDRARALTLVAAIERRYAAAEFAWIWEGSRQIAASARSFTLLEVRRGIAFCEVQTDLGTVRPELQLDPLDGQWRYFKCGVPAAQRREAADGLARAPPARRCGRALRLARAGVAAVQHELPALGESAWELGGATETLALVRTLGGDAFRLVALDGTAPAAQLDGPAYSFRLLGPRFLYNVEDLRFYRRQAPLRATALPRPLVPVTGEDDPLNGDHHAIRVPAGTALRLGP
jgi:hypothetical protein